MKTNKKTFIFFLLAGLIVSSCGKNNSSSPENNWGGGIGNNVGGGNANLDQNSQQAIQRLNAWYSGNQEGQVAYWQFAKGKISQNNNQGQECLKLFGMNIGCANWGYGWGAPQYSYTHKTCVWNNNGNGVIFAKTISKSENCQTQQHNNIAYTKNDNQVLKEIFQSNSSLVPISAIDNGYGVITVWMGHANGYPTPVKAFVIDTKLHSVYNPIQYTDQSGTTSLIY